MPNGSPDLDLTVPTPQQPSAIQTIGALGNLSGLRSEIALRNQQMQTAAAAQANVQAEANQRQADQADQNTMQERMKDPDFAHSVSSWDGKSPFPLDGLIQPKNSLVYQNAIIAQQKERASLTPQARAENDAMHAQIGQTVNGIANDENGNPRSDADVARLAPTAFAELVKDGQLKPENVPVVTNRNDLMNFASTNRYVQGLGEAASALQVAAGKPAAQTAATAKDTASANDLNASAAKTNALLPGDVAKQATENDIAAADSAFRAKNGGLSANEVALNKIAKGTLSVSQAEQSIRQKTFDATYGPNAQQTGLAGVRPNLVGPASAAFEKAGTEYATASGAADAMQTVIDLAQKGNKEANSNLPLVGVETLNALNGIKRINGAEIAQYGNAGSLLDKIQGKIGSLTVGKPIPQDVLDDIRELHTTIAQQAGTTYQRKVQVTNQTYGSKFQPVQFTSSAGSSVVPITLKDGRILTPASQAQADAFRKDHPELIQ